MQGATGVLSHRKRLVEGNLQARTALELCGFEERRLFGMETLALCAATASWADVGAAAGASVVSEDVVSATGLKTAGKNDDRPARVARPCSVAIEQVGHAPRVLKLRSGNKLAKQSSNRDEV